MGESHCSRCHHLEATRNERRLRRRAKMGWMWVVGGYARPMSRTPPGGDEVSGPPSHQYVLACVGQVAPKGGWLAGRPGRVSTPDTHTYTHTTNIFITSPFRRPTYYARRRPLGGFRATGPPPRCGSASLSLSLFRPEPSSKTRLLVALFGPPASIYAQRILRLRVRNWAA